MHALSKLSDKWRICFLDEIPPSNQKIKASDYKKNKI